MKIKVKLSANNVVTPQIVKGGDAIDLIANEDITLKPSDFYIIDLGVAIKLPKGFVSIVIPRSSTFKNYGILFANSVGFIDNSYQGNEDVWKFPVYFTKYVTIPKGTRIAQFYVQLSQFATIIQKLKWLFSNKVTIEAVSNLSDINRGGLGSTGK